jgi:uncharacterized protein (DUF3820 family)
MSDYIIKFGKYKDKRLDQVPMKYLSWMLRELTPGSGNDYLLSQIREYKKTLKKNKVKINCK